ncbi:DeoR/GlpR family DNA-binding transcription regulator [Clostridium lacusfryxellense]|uniref:DeoR/GlpR family DNA-binding transcription regulator n=1 Tax=Clostridium lacusfryxellense TaxID=205328 RepID=UPI001C0BBC4A|nr:DeoR/GlpR family DNA-binding transcription regulator [Clostridium lacusfryxellense]MBU3112731.1 DeoR/GlpR family DNA-binding transcription regulator [Clostridium lacusfryxellense]
MFAAERLAKVREVLLEYKHVDISTLSSILSVSEATIRRDLEKLEDEGFLTKTHGGAVINEDVDQEVVLSFIDDPYIEEKKQIGIIASQMIINGDVIFLGSGTTCQLIAKHIKDRKQLTVVTNNMNIIIELYGCNNINLIVLGGNIQSVGNSISTSGQFSKKMLEGIFVNKAFFSVDGISIEHGYTISSVELSEIYNIILQNAGESIIVVDYSKFDKRAFVQLGNIDLVKKVVTNAQVSLEYKKLFFETNIQLFTAFNEDKVDER